MSETPESVQPRKGLPTIAWVGIGCGVLLIVGFVVLFAGMMLVARQAKKVADDFADNPAKKTAEWVVRMNPELELVSTDDDAETITVKNVKTGEVATFDFAEIEQGKFRFESGDGEVSLEATGDEETGSITLKTNEGELRFGEAAAEGEVPDWVPIYPGTEPMANFSSRTGEQESGSMTLKTSDGPDEIMAFYQEQVEELGFQIKHQSTSQTGETKQVMLVATLDDGRQSLTVTSNTAKGETTIVLGYQRKLQP